MYLGRDAATAGEPRRLALCHVQHQVHMVAVQLCRLGDDVDIIKQAHAEDHINVLLGLAGAKDLQQGEQARPPALTNPLPPIMHVDDKAEHDHKAGQKTLQPLAPCRKAGQETPEVPLQPLAPFCKLAAFCFLQNPETGDGRLVSGRRRLHWVTWKALQAITLQHDVCMTQSALSQPFTILQCFDRDWAPLLWPEPAPSSHCAHSHAAQAGAYWQLDSDLHGPAMSCCPSSTQSGRCLVPSMCCTPIWSAAAL